MRVFLEISMWSNSLSKEHTHTLVGQTAPHPSRVLIKPAWAEKKKKKKAVSSSSVPVGYPQTTTCPWTSQPYVLVSLAWGFYCYNETLWPKRKLGYGGLKMLGPGNGTIRRCGLVGGSASLWGGLWDPPPSFLTTVCSWLPLDEDVELSAPPAPCLSGCSCVSYYNNNGLKL